MKSKHYFLGGGLLFGVGFGMYSAEPVIGGVLMCCGGLVALSGVFNKEDDEEDEL